MMDKKQIRTDMKTALAKMDRDEAIRAGKAAAARLVAQREFTDARTVMIFLPMADEIDPRDIARAAWSTGKRVATPKIRAPGVMDAVEIRSLDDGLAPGAMNILEPIESNILSPGELDLIVAPALAYDRKGNRLGRGGGYFDRFLEQTNGALVCGLAFSGQVLDEIPVQPHDRPVNMLATDIEFLRFPRNCGR